MTHAYRYLHFKVVSVQLDADVCYRSLEEPGGSQHQHQLQVSWKRPLNSTPTCLITLLKCSFIHSFIHSHTQLLLFNLDLLISAWRPTVKGVYVCVYVCV